MDANSTIVSTVPRVRKASQPDEIVVFWIVRDSACAECGEDLGKGRFLRMEKDRPLCLACADLDHLVFLGRGDAALTRRASRYSTLRAVVVRFSRSRKRYERQGVLVEEQALARAERECLSDAEARRLARDRTTERRPSCAASHPSQSSPASPPRTRCDTTSHSKRRCSTSRERRARTCP